MGRALKIGLWLGVAVLVVGIVAKTFGISLPFGETRTVRQYMQEVVAKGTLGEISKIVAAQYAKKLGEGFDAAQFQRDMDACLHRRVGTWLHGDDPRLAEHISHDAVNTLAAEFTKAYVTDLSAEVR